MNNPWKARKIDYEYVFFGRHRRHRAARYFTIIVLLAAAISVAMLYMPNATEKTGEANYLTAGYFGDDTSFNGLTLPFPEGTEYSYLPDSHSPHMYDFYVKEGTPLLAAAPGRVRDIRGYPKTVEIRLNYTADLYLVYVIGNSDEIILSPSDVQRGQRIGTISNEIYNGSNINLGMQITGPGQRTINESNFWAAGSPKYYRE